MSKNKPDRHALGPPFKLTVCAVLGALALAVSAAGGGRSTFSDDGVGPGTGARASDIT